MHEILTTTRATLTDRAAELESLIKAGEEQCQAIADDGNRQIKVITDKAAADIGAINAELEKHVTELAGVQHSIGTIDAVGVALAVNGSKTPKADPRDPDQPMTDAEAEAEAVMLRHLQADEVRQAGISPALSLDGSNSVVTRLTEKKQP